MMNLQSLALTESNFSRNNIIFSDAEMKDPVITIISLYHCISCVYFHIIARYCYYVICRVIRSSCSRIQINVVIIHPLIYHPRCSCSLERCFSNTFLNWRTKFIYLSRQDISHWCECRLAFILMNPQWSLRDRSPAIRARDSSGLVPLRFWSSRLHLPSVLCEIWSWRQQ